MSISSIMLRIAFKHSDDKRDKGLTTPENILRFDNIRYGQDPKWNILDVYRPKSVDGPFPVIVSVHGGGWVYGDKDRYQYYCMSLAQQGFAGKTGNFVYQAEFEGRARILSLEMTGGVAEVELNGNPAGICWGSDMLSIARYVQEGKNQLTIRFANTAGNLYGDKNAPFGIVSIAVEG